MESEPVTGGSCYELARSGTVEAFLELRRRHEREIFRLIRYRLRNNEDAEDVAQECWLRIARRGAQARDPERFHAWLHSVARNSVVDFVRLKYRRPLLTSDDASTAARADPDAVDPQQVVHDVHSGGEQTWHALNALPLRQRSVLALRGLYELSYAEIAARLGISRGAAEVLVSRGRTRLREILRGPDAPPHSCPVALRYVLLLIDGASTATAARLLRQHATGCVTCAFWTEILDQPSTELRAG
jgi:RNA polymerase sigma-70 factor (ECF subfamily)